MVADKNLYWRLNSSFFSGTQTYLNAYIHTYIHRCAHPPTQTQELQTGYSRIVRKWVWNERQCAWVRTNPDKVVSFLELPPGLARAVVCHLVMRCASSPSRHTPGALQSEAQRPDSLSWVVCVWHWCAVGTCHGTAENHRFYSAHICVKWAVKWICLSVFLISAVGRQILIKFSTVSLWWQSCGFLSCVSVGPI